MASRGIQVNVAEIIEDSSIRRADDAAYVKRYKRGRYLGKGGFAKCYELTSMDSNRSYAGKIIPKTSLAKPSSRKKLLNEIKIHRSIRDPNVVRFERFFEDKENVYILLELCPNHSLMELMKRRKRLTEVETQYYMWSILSTVKSLHAANIIHRDLKLGNLFLGEHMEIKAGDFGLAAKLSHPSERKRTICGTPNYIAPEILDNQNGHSFEVDVWAMGVIMYTLLIGRPPFETASVKSTYKRIRANSYVFPAHIQISQAAKELIVRILHSQPELRPTLDEMSKHAFFTQSPIPTALPISILNTPFMGEDVHPVAMSSNFDIASKETVPLSNAMDMPRAPLGEKQTSAPAMANNIIVANAAVELRAGQENTGARTARPVRVAAKPFGSSENQLLQPSNHNNVKQPLTAWTTTDITKKSPTFNSVNLPPTNPFIPSTKFTESTKPKENLNKSPLSTGASENSRGPSREVSSPNDDNCLQVGSKKDILVSNGGNIDDDRDKDDVEEVKQMHDCIEKSFLICQNEPDVQSLPDNGLTTRNVLSKDVITPAELWVNKWVDYSNKYGLGYLLSNGNIGVYFNDSSKLILHKNGYTFEHIPRRASNSGANTIPTREKLDLDHYPAALQKKVTLLKHFRNYLLQHKHNNDENNNANIGNSNSNPPIEKQPDMSHMDIDMDMVDNPNNRPDKMVYVKKWLRTKHAILFRLSDRTVQVIFYDHTEVILSSEDRMVTYTNKEKHRNTYPLQTVFNNPKPDLAKRMKYIKDILFHLLSHKTKG